MFPLAGKTFPKSGDELARSIEGTIGGIFALSKGGPTVTVEGVSFPSLDRVNVDLSGATLDPANPPPRKPDPLGRRERGIDIQAFDVVGHPICLGTSPLHFDAHAADVRCDFDMDRNGTPLLILTSVREGTLQTSISSKDLENALLEGAKRATRQQGVAIQELNVSLSSAGPRSLLANVRIKAKKMMMSGIIHVRGRLDVDDELNAVLTGLTCTGEGMVGNVAAAMVQGKLRELEGRKTPLAGFALGGVKLREVTIDAGDLIRLTATFGSA